MAPKLVSYFKIKFIQKDVADLLTNIFWETMTLRESQNTKRNDLVDLLIGLKNEDTSLAGKIKL